jgi:hypothetical protein
VNLSAWGAVSVEGRLGGGHRNEVRLVRRAGVQLVARRSRRSAAALDWELDLLAFLAGHGFLVPEVVPALDGRRHVGGVVVQRWLPGREPSGSDWPAVAAELRRLHAVTVGWPQRPGFRSTSDLLVADRGGDVDLRAMPDAAVVACRRAWAALAESAGGAAADPEGGSAGRAVGGRAAGSDGSEGGLAGDLLIDPAGGSATCSMRGSAGSSASSAGSAGSATGAAHGAPDGSATGSAGGPATDSATGAARGAADGSATSIATSTAASSASGAARGAPGGVTDSAVGGLAVVHGDPCAANVRVSADGIGLLDWDEARVDHPDLDFADLPSVELPTSRSRVARAAVAAWEAAAGWQLEPDYARRRLAELG